MRAIGVILIVIVALTCGAFASVLAYNYLRDNRANQGPELVPLAVSVRDITFGTTLTKEDMEVVLYPIGSVPDGAYENIDSLVGQSTKVFLKKKEPILDSKLSSIGGGLSLLIGDNQRAASILVDKISGVSGFVLPGDKVDIIATIARVGSKRESIAKTILQNTEVLAAGEKIERKGDKVIAVQSVTLLVDPDGAQALALASIEGKLHLSLRNPNDSITVQVDPVSKSGILAAEKKKSKPQPKKSKPRVKKTQAKKKIEPPKKPDSVVVFRGTDKTEELPVMDGQDSTIDSTSTTKP
ncbi:MAG: Flp pilus assembly protein CpaB [candidate division Zixibacteria bacterium]|nr:Flp pilus assembly protein CpaB [candidate division Zixibacteria bacterium]